MNHLAVFASGSGTNAQRLAEYFSGHPAVNLSLIISNKPDAYVLERARRLNIPSFVFSPAQFRESSDVLEKLEAFRISHIVLAGFLLLLPPSLVRDYPGRIINIHPALLPLYGGKGMYGHHVHEAIIAAGEKESGISIHLVNEKYDDGNILFQARCPVYPDDTADSLAQRIHHLEYEHYPRVVEEWVLRDL